MKLKLGILFIISFVFIQNTYCLNIILNPDTVDFTITIDTVANKIITKNSGYKLKIKNRSIETVDIIEKYLVDDNKKILSRIVLKYDTNDMIKTIEYNEKKYKRNEFINFLEKINFENGNWQFIIEAPIAYETSIDPNISKYTDSIYGIDSIMSNLTYGLYNENLKSFCAGTTNKSILNKLKQNFKFKIRGGYLTTAYLHISLLKDGVIEYSADLFNYTNFVKINSYGGYMEAVNSKELNDLFKLLEPMNYEEYHNIKLNKK